jgi:signal transduction histidine kinase
MALDAPAPAAEAPDTAPAASSSLASHALGPFGYAAIAVAVAILFVVAAASVWLAAGNREGLEVVADAQRVQLAISRLRNAVDDAETSQRGYLLSNRAEYLQPFLAARTGAPAQLAIVQTGLAHDDAARPHLQRLTDAVTEKLAELQRTVDFVSGGDRAAAIAELLTDRGKALMDQVRSETAALAMLQQARLTREEQRISDRGRWIVLTDSAGLVLVILLAAWVAWGLRRHVAALREARQQLHAANAQLEHANETLERTVAIRTADLREANDEIQRFAYIVSHDLRAPLVNIMGFTSELEAATGELGNFIRTVAAAHPEEVPEQVTEAANDDLPEAIRFIKTSTAKMDRLIGAILRLSREGRRVLTPERLDMTQLLGNIADTLRHQASESATEITVEALPALTADRVAVEQIFGNLMENALKYLQPGRPGRIRVTGTLSGRTACYAIADNGRGIAERDHERIFELFRRAGDQTVAGEGIGLAHVRALVRRLGGTIDCESTLGVGSTFRIRLPAITAPARSAA